MVESTRPPSRAVPEPPWPGGLMPEVELARQGARVGVVGMPVSSGPAPGRSGSDA